MSTAFEAKELVKDAIKNGEILSIVENGIGDKGQQSYKIIIDAGKIVGTKGEEHIRIIVDSLNNIWTIFPE